MSSVHRPGISGRRYSRPGMGSGHPTHSAASAACSARFGSEHDQNKMFHSNTAYQYRMDELFCRS